MKTTLLGRLLTMFAITLTSTAQANQVLPERKVPAPVGISAELNKFINQKQNHPDMPVPKSTKGWLQLQKAFDKAGTKEVLAGMKKHNISYQKQKIAGVDTFIVTPDTIKPEYQNVRLIHVHGGAFVFGGDEMAMAESAWLAQNIGAEIVSIAYRRPPQHPFPATIDDAIAVWKEVIKTQDPKSTALFGSSAGGNITLATTLKLQELNLPLPGALFVGTPAIDLKHTSDTWHTLKGLDTLGQREGILQATFDLYANGENLENPLLSPVYGQYKDFPPTIFISGTRDLLLSDTVRMHRKLRAADIETELHVFDGISHGDYIRGLTHDFPESRDAAAEIGVFFKKHLKL